MQTTTNEFNQIVTSAVRPLSWDVAISFDKSYNDTINFFELDTSTLDSGDLLVPTDAEAAIIQRWDYYAYTSYKSRIQSVEWSREMDFPSSVSAAMADFVLENFNDYFTPNSTSPIAPYVLPKRPVRISSGFAGENLPQFIGITEKMPVVDRATKLVSFHAIDFLSQLYSLPLNEQLAMQDVRTDEVLAAMFDQFGLQPDQYDLAEGYNTISYLYFEKGKNAGNAIADLMTAEMGNLWLDETGVIRFEPRVITELEEQYRFDTSNTNSIKIIDKDDIINKVAITSEIREVKEYQKIYQQTEGTTEAVTIKANDTLVLQASLDDPVTTIDTPTLGTQVEESFFTFKKVSDNTDVTTNVTMTGSVLRANNYVMFFSNTNAFDVAVDTMELWGTPAKVVDTITYTKTDPISIEKYGEQVLEINNNFIQTIDACEGLAFSVLDTFSEYAGQIELDVKGNPAIQLGDIVFVDIQGYSGHYKIKKITNRIQEGRYTQTITARRQILRDYFELDEDVLDGDTVLSI